MAAFHPEHCRGSRAPRQTRLTAWNLFRCRGTFFAMKDKDLIDSGEWVPCRICEDTFGRKRETRRYCATCLNAACEGEHGNFAYIHTSFTCVICSIPNDYKTRQQTAPVNV
jgi:hypothetical protein